MIEIVTQHNLNRLKKLIDDKGYFVMACDDISCGINPIHFYEDKQLITQCFSVISETTREEYESQFSRILNEPIPVSHPKDKYYRITTD